MILICLVFIFVHNVLSIFRLTCIIIAEFSIFAMTVFVLLPLYFIRGL